ncbi:MAG: hypothetical protein JST92_02690 [Deltaproteobacteria bacterium]|nr:hypothetical protein [Deltaproteobacteria bacterium]
MEQDKKNPEPGPQQKKAYERPAIVSSELFERRALACGTQPSGRGQPGCGVFHQSV